MKHYAHYLTTTQYFKLDAACIPLWAAFGSEGGVYLVGSVLLKPDFRDVDIRVILNDAEYDRLFPMTDRWGENAQWKIICISISHYLSNVTGLPIDFQIQRQTQANARYASKDGHERNAIGLFIHGYDSLPARLPEGELPSQAQENNNRPICRTAGSAEPSSQTGPASNQGNGD